MPTYQPFGDYGGGTSVYQPGSTVGSYGTPQVGDLDFYNTETTSSITPISGGGWEYTHNGVDPYGKPTYNYTRRVYDNNKALTGLLGEYTRAYNEGAAANVQRYEDILSGARDRYASTMEGLAGLGEAQANRIDQRYDAQQGAVQQAMIDRGLHNSTVPISMMQGVERERGYAHDDLAEQIRRENLGYHTQLSGDVLNFMERRTDSYPSLDQLTALANTLGQSNSSIPFIYTTGSNTVDNRGQGAAYRPPGTVGFNSTGSGVSGGGTSQGSSSGGSNFDQGGLGSFGSSSGSSSSNGTYIDYSSGNQDLSGNSNSDQNQNTSQGGIVETDINDDNNNQSYDADLSGIPEYERLEGTVGLNSQGEQVNSSGMTYQNISSELTKVMREMNQSIPRWTTRSRLIQSLYKSGEDIRQFVANI